MLKMEPKSAACKTDSLTAVLWLRAPSFFLFKNRNTRDLGQGETVQWALALHVSDLDLIFK